MRRKKDGYNERWNGVSFAHIFVSTRGKIILTIRDDKNKCMKEAHEEELEIRREKDVAKNPTWTSIDPNMHSTIEKLRFLDFKSKSDRKKNNIVLQNSITSAKPIIVDLKCELKSKFTFEIHNE